MQPVEERLAALGLVLPEPLKLPAGVTLPFPWVRVVGARAIISGHGPTTADGTLAHPLGKVGADVTEEQAYEAARLTGQGKANGNGLASTAKAEAGGIGCRVAARL